MQKSLPLSRRVASALAILSGFLYFLAFPGIDVWPVSFIAWVPLFVALRRQPPKRALWLGWLAGFTMTMCGFYWLLNMLQTFSGFPLPLCFLFMAILCGYQAGRIGLMGWLYARAEQRGWPVSVAVLLAFAASEQGFPLLFPWAYGATVHQVPLLTQTAEIGGPILVGLALICINLVFSELCIARLEARATRWKPLLGLAAAPIATIVFGAIRIGQIDERVAQAEPATIGVVQANMSLLGKHKDREEGLRRHLKMTRQLQRGQDLDLVVWSETSVMSPIDEAAAASEIPDRFSDRIGVPAIVGAVLTRPVQDARRHVLFNSAILTDKKGRVRGRYDKQFLLAFGEYLPLGETFPILYDWSPHSGRFSAGKSYLPLTLGRRQFATFICYEDIIPGFVNEIVRTGSPDLLVNMTNDAWFGDTTEPWIHLALSQFRAIEHRRFFVRSTNSGISAFVDPVGRVLSHTEAFKEETLIQKVAWLRTTTIYEILGDVPWWLAVMASAALATFRRRHGVTAITAKSERALPATDGPQADPSTIEQSFRQKSRSWLGRGTN